MKYDQEAVVFERHMPLSRHSHYRIGGTAGFFASGRSIGQIYAATAAAQKHGAPLFVMGGGTNILFHDRGFSGVVIKVENAMLQLLRGYTVRVGAGTTVEELLDLCVARGLSGLEWAGGLPGTVGGAIRGNAGAFGGEIKDSVISVTSIDYSCAPPRIHTRAASECLFGYRDSIFKHAARREIIVEVVLRLAPGSKDEIREKIEEKIAYRNKRHPMEYPNIGSIFKNVPAEQIGEENKEKISHVIKTDPFPVVPAAYLLSEAGVKGITKGGAMISPKHPNFIVNCLAASSADVAALISHAKEEIKHVFDIALTEEIEYVG